MSLLDRIVVRNLVLPKDGLTAIEARELTVSARSRKPVQDNTQTGPVAGDTQGQTEAVETNSQQPL